MTAGAAPLWDSHCHLQDLDDPAAALSKAAQAGVAGVVTIGTDVASSVAALGLAGRDGAGPVVAASVGLHPHHASSTGDQGVVGLAALLAAHGTTPEIVAVGECGLDYFYEHSPRDDQRKAFEEQIELARLYSKTLVIHTRDAWEDTFSILAAADLPDRVVLHCFTGGPEEAQKCLEMGMWVSFSGIVTFANAHMVREAVRICPPDRVLAETDSPFLTPVPHRGKPNEPAHVGLVVAAVATEMGIDRDVLAAQIADNTEKAFGLGQLP